MNRLTAALAAMLTLGCALLAVVPSAEAEIVVTDVEGRRVTLAAPAQRVLLGFYYEDFLAIVGPGAMDRVVAISRAPWKDWRPMQYRAYAAAIPRIEALADVGSLDAGSFAVEAAVAARPDVAILAAWQFKGLGPAVATLEAAGVPVVVVDYNAQTVERHVASTLVIGKVMGAEARAERLAAAYRAAVEDTTARVERADGGRPRVYVELGQKGPAEYGNSYGNGMWAGVIALAGGDNIAAGQVASWGPLSPEYVLASQPEVVLITGSEWLNAPDGVLMGFGIEQGLTRERLAGYPGRPGWQDLPAVAGGQVHALYHGGTRTLYDYVYLRYLAKVLHPAAFADVDPAAELKAYYARNLPIAAEGTFMLRLAARP
ncbi:MAG: ABC transporter substrate-binding protein [Thalassobaculum sp.]|uniref:ABC transporter substrate-binding protein n=1 Tax=Thalassobaculum sp. TaxID=2022740 RepID=UPI0032EB1E31